MVPNPVQSSPVRLLIITPLYNFFIINLTSLNFWSTNTTKENAFMKREILMLIMHVNSLSFEFRSDDKVFSASLSCEDHEHLHPCLYIHICVCLCLRLVAE